MRTSNRDIAKSVTSSSISGSSGGHLSFASIFSSKSSSKRTALISSIISVAWISFWSVGLGSGSSMLTGFWSFLSDSSNSSSSSPSLFPGAISPFPSSDDSSSSSKGLYPGHNEWGGSSRWLWEWEWINSCSISFMLSIILLISGSWVTKSFGLCTGLPGRSTESWLMPGVDSGLGCELSASSLCYRLRLVEKVILHTCAHFFLLRVHGWFELPVGDKDALDETPRSCCKIPDCCTMFSSSRSCLAWHQCIVGLRNNPSAKFRRHFEHWQSLSLLDPLEGVSM